MKMNGKIYLRSKNNLGVKSKKILNIIEIYCTKQFSKDEQAIFNDNCILKSLE